MSIIVGFTKMTFLAQLANLAKDSLMSGKKFIKGLAKYSNEMTKRSILTNSDFTKMTNLETTYLGLANIKTR